MFNRFFDQYVAELQQSSQRNTAQSSLGTSHAFQQPLSPPPVQTEVNQTASHQTQVDSIAMTVKSADLDLIDLQRRAPLRADPYDADDDADRSGDDEMDAAPLRANLSDGHLRSVFVAVFGIRTIASTLLYPASPGLTMAR